MTAISVLIVDDSAVVRQVLTDILSSAPGFSVMGAVSDPIFALRRMQARWPDVIVLDIDMPRMDGITFLKKIMAEHPTPVVICSTLTANGAQVTMEAMASGALDIITKPKVGLKHFFEESKTLLTDSIRAAKSARMSKVRAQPTPAMRNEPKLNADAVIPQLSRPLISTTGRVVALGTSTGGTQALETILTALPCASPGILVVQHMPEQFTRAFAERLDGVCNVRVKEAEQGDRVVPGLVLIAPGGAHMLLRRSGTQYRAEIKDGPLVSRHRPSVDVLFRSVAQVAGRNATGIIMTGMGDDGAHGLEEMHAAGALTVAQDEATCVVYGMPKEAVARGAVDISIPLQEIPKVILANQSRSRFLENQQLQ